MNSVIHREAYFILTCEVQHSIAYQSVFLLFNTNNNRYAKFFFSIKKILKNDFSIKIRYCVGLRKSKCSKPFDTCLIYN